MRTHIMSERRDSGIKSVVTVLKGMGLSFTEIADKIAERFNLSLEKAQKKVEEY